MAVELYFFQPLVTNSARVFQTLLEKGVPFVEHELDGLNFEHVQPAYLKVNPAGQVPALVHDGRPLTEGMLVNEYIDEVFEGPPLRPADPAGRARMRLWSRYADTDLGRSLMMINWNRRMGDMNSRRDPGAFERAVKNVPDPDRRRAWLSAATRQTPPEKIEESHRRVRAGLQRIEQALAAHPWIAGDSFSLADIDVMHFTGFTSMWLPDWIGELFNAKDTPAIMDWLDRYAARPAAREVKARTRMPAGRPPDPAAAASTPAPTPAA